MYYFYNVSGSGKLYFQFETSDKNFIDKEIVIAKAQNLDFAVCQPDGTWIEN